MTQIQFISYDGKILHGYLDGDYVVRTNKTGRIVKVKVTPTVKSKLGEQLYRAV